MNIEEIPSDEIVEMTNAFHEAFNSAGCDPMCHCCNNMILVGSLFKLSTVRDATPEKNNGHINQDLVNLIKSGKKEIKGVYRNTHFTVKEEDLFQKSKEVMLCGICTAELYEDKQKKKILTYHTQGGCFRINGKIIH